MKLIVIKMNHDWMDDRPYGW